MIDRHWLGDIALAVLLVLPTAALMWPSPTASAPQLRSNAGNVARISAVPHSQIEQRFGLRR